MKAFTIISVEKQTIHLEDGTRLKDFSFEKVKYSWIQLKYCLPFFRESLQSILMYKNADTHYSVHCFPGTRDRNIYLCLEEEPPRDVDQLYKAGRPVGPPRADRKTLLRDFERAKSVLIDTFIKQHDIKHEQIKENQVPVITQPNSVTDS